MAYTAPTVEEFRTKFPEFTDADYSDAAVEAALNEAARSVDESWTEGDFKNARMYLAGHYLSVLQSAGVSLGQDNLKALSIGPLSLTFGDKVSFSEFSSTPYGQQFRLLQKKNIGPAILVV